MYPIGRLSHKRAAQAFVDYLNARSIFAKWRNEETYYIILVAEQMHIADAQRELEAFIQNPTDEKYLIASWQSGELETTQSALFSSDFFQDFWARAGVVCKLFVILSLLFSVWTEFGYNRSALELWVFHWPSILAGEVWRIIMPIFLHFSVAGIVYLHLLFNMMWLWDLGGRIEKSEGSFKLLYLILGTGALSNIAQFIASPTIIFGGMSGVVYGLLGYCWIDGYRRPNSPLKLPDWIVYFMLIWLVMGFLGVLGPVANASHLFGLLSGIGFSWLASHKKNH